MGRTARDLASPDFPAVAPEDPVRVAAYKMFSAKLSAIPVVSAGGSLEGVLRNSDVLYLVARDQSASTPVSDLMLTGYPALEPDHRLERPSEARLPGLPFAPVVENGKLLGVVTPRDVDVQGLLEQHLGGDKASRLITEIHPDDDMYHGVKGEYLRAGLEALVHVRRALRLAKAGLPRTILDMPSGHGRVLRFLKAAFPEAELTACDIKRDAVDFCSEVMGARGVYSEADFAKIRMETRFDLIWVGSLFTHLDRPDWLQLLSFLADRLTPGGLLVFTTIARLNPGELRTMAMTDAQIPQMELVYDRDGFAHQPYEGIDEWGLTLCSEDFVRTAVGAHGDLEMVNHAPAAWIRLQDVFACVKGGVPTMRHPVARR